MSLNLNKLPRTNGPSKFKIEPLEAGTYPARVVQIIDLGLQAQQPYQGQEKSPRYEMQLTYELVDAFLKDEEGNDLEDKPRWVSEKFGLNPLDNDKATSTKRYNALDPTGDAGGDFTALIGAACNVTIALNVGKGKNAGKIYENVSAVTAVRARDLARFPELINTPKVFTLDNPDLDVFRSLPEWLQKAIKDNLEYEGSTLQKALQAPTSPSKGDTKATPKGKAQKATQAHTEAREEEETTTW